MRPICPRVSPSCGYLCFISVGAGHYCGATANPEGTEGVVGAAERGMTWVNMESSRRIWDGWCQ